MNRSWHISKKLINVQVPVCRGSTESSGLKPSLNESYLINTVQCLVFKLHHNTTLKKKSSEEDRFTHYCEKKYICNFPRKCVFSIIFDWIRDPYCRWKNDINDISVAIDSESVHQKRMLSNIINQIIYHDFKKSIWAVPTNQTLW